MLAKCSSWIWISICICIYFRQVTTTPAVRRRAFFTTTCWLQSWQSFHRINFKVQMTSCIGDSLLWLILLMHIRVVKLTKIYMKFRVNAFGEPKFMLQMIRLNFSSSFQLDLLLAWNIPKLNCGAMFSNMWSLFRGALLLPSFFHEWINNASNLFLDWLFLLNPQMGQR